VVIVDLFKRERLGFQERSCRLTDVSPLRVRSRHGKEKA
jgi:hypothetical protein